MNSPVPTDTPDPFLLALADRLVRLGIADDGKSTTPLIVAVSGGADSTALLCGLAELRAARPLDLTAAHLDHAARPDSAADAAAVANLCRELGVPLIAERRDGGGTSEAALRADRLAFLRRGALSVPGEGEAPAEPVGRSPRSAPAAAKQDGACGSTARREPRPPGPVPGSSREQHRWVLTAHTADDQTETVLHRLVRGTGLDGLAGIPAARPLGDGVTLGRPMLGVTRAEVVAYLHRAGRAWREDTTNRDETFTRNRIRHAVRPLLRELNPRADAAVRRLADAAAESARTTAALAAALAEGMGAEVRVDRFTVPAGRLAALPAPARRAVLRSLWRSAGFPEGRMDRTAWDRLAHAAGGGPAVSLPGGVAARRAGGAFECRRDR